MTFESWWIYCQNRAFRVLNDGFRSVADHKALDTHPSYGSEHGEVELQVEQFGRDFEICVPIDGRDLRTQGMGVASPY